jgi:DNA replication protein DnaC
MQTKKCKQCSQLFMGKYSKRKVFCSRKCGQTYNNTQRSLANPEFTTCQNSDGKSQASTFRGVARFCKAKEGFEDPLLFDVRRTERLTERRRKQAQFRDPQKTLDNFDFNFNKKMNRSLVFDLATATFIARHEDALFLGPPGTGKSHLAQAIGHAVLGQGYRVIYRETHTLLEEIADASIDGTRKEHMELLATVPLLIIDDLGMRKLAPTAAEELLEIVMRRHERASKLLTSNRPVEDWGKLLGDSAVVTAMLDRLLHHGHILKCGPRSWRTKTDLPEQDKVG